MNAYNAYMYLAMLGNQLLSSIFGWIIKIKRYFCSIKTIKT